MAIGIIAEYNPFHNGHKYQLQEAIKRFPGEDIIVIMSGKYVQRGELAVSSFDTRKEMALKNGATKVVELPFEYATQAAHIFAQGAMKIANEIGVDKIFFGSESNSPEHLLLIANTLKNNRLQYRKLLKAELKKGVSFPRSAAFALREITGFNIVLPNDILGLEYTKAIVDNGYNIEIHTLKRTVGFHSNEIVGNFASASKIREMIFNEEDISQYTEMSFDAIPDKIENYYKKFQKIVIDMPVEDLKNIKMISEGMENRFKKFIHLDTYDEFVNTVNSKRYTSTRIKRTMLYVLLKIKKDKELDS